ncbi:MAG: sigma-70 family RNA polymerase sigma factor [Elusimicrobiota bacterium]|nr:sigma-70 family RNA polymerase sigma factor [Elusimicrobiota bacterium]
MLSDPSGWPDAHGDRLYRYALSRVRDESAAEDLVQETLLTAYKSRDRFKGESSELTWLTGILRFKIFEFYRRQAKEVPLGFDEGDDRESELFEGGRHWRPEQAPRDWGADPVRAAEGAEFFAALRACLDALTPAAARAFTLREMEGVEHHEAAEAIGVAPGHLAVLLYRARMRLRRCLERGYFVRGAA